MMRVVHGILFCLTIAGFHGEADGFKIAFLVGNAGSHVIMMGRMAELFANKGHDVTLVLPSNTNVPAEIEAMKLDEMRFHFTEFMAPFAPKSRDLFHEMAFNPSIHTKLKTFGMLTVDYHFQFGYSLLESKEVMARMTNEKWDFIVVDAVLVTYMLLPYKLGVRYGIFGVECFGHLRRIPEMPSYVPHTITPFSDRMSFMERLLNTLVSFGPGLTGIGPSDISSKHVPERPPAGIYDLVKNASVCFKMRENVIDFVRPEMPDVIQVAAIMGRAAKPLKGNLRNLLDSATGGAILVSFGSGVSELPVDVLEKFMTAFEQLKQRIIFKYKHQIPDVPSNVHVVSWMPQNDLLGHPNLKLFITHCGMNSYIEAVNQGVPVLGFPVSLDQFGIGAIIQEKGLGEILKIHDFTAEQLSATVQQLLNDKRYMEAVKKQSSIYREVQASGLRDPVFWVEQVIKYGVSHLRSHAFVMPDYQYLMMDVFAFIVVVILTVISILLMVCRCLVRCLCKGVHRKSKEE